MNFITFDNEANDFKKRIIEAFQLMEDQGKLIRHKRKVIEWLRKKQQELQIQKKAQPTSNIIKALLQKSAIEQKKKKLQRQIALHCQLKEFIKTKNSSEKNFEEFINDQFFQEIKESLQVLVQKQIKEYYGLVKAPLIGDMYIDKKENFRLCVENSPHHNLKFIVTQAKVAHKYQRNLVQQVFGRVIRKKGALSLMIKIEVDVQPDEKDIDIFCYIEDLNFKGGQEFKQLSEVKVVEINEETYAIQVQNHERKTLQINREGLLELMLSIFY